MNPAGCSFLPRRADMNAIGFSRWPGVVALCAFLAACPSRRDEATQTQAFCDSIRPGEAYQNVAERFPRHRLQPGGFAPHPRERLAGSIAAETIPKVTGVLLEPSGVKSELRPVCAVYYSDAFLGGDGKVLLAEFKPRWDRRH